MSDPKAWRRLNPVQAREWLLARPQALLLDAREAHHHAQGHLAGSLRLDGRNHEALLLREPKDRPVFILCYHGHASQTYAGMFVDFGFREVADLRGGWAAIDSAGCCRGPLAIDDLPATPVPPALAAWLATEGFDPARPAAPGAHGNTPLMHAAWRGAHHALDALLAFGVPLDAVNDDGNNALWLACVNGEPGILRALALLRPPRRHPAPSEV